MTGGGSGGDASLDMATQTHVLLTKALIKKGQN